MKRILIALIILISFISQGALAVDKKVGSYTMSGIELGIYANLDDEGLIVGIEAFPTNPQTGTRPIIKIKGRYDLMDFRVVLKLSMEKMIEWTQIAKKEGIYNHSKVIDPGEYTKAEAEIHWKGDNGMNYSSFSMEIPFLYDLDMGDAMILAGGTVSHWADDNIKQKWVLAFKSPSEIQVLIDALDEKRILPKL